MIFKPFSLVVLVTTLTLANNASAAYIGQGVDPVDIKYAEGSPTGVTFNDVGTATTATSPGIYIWNEGENNPFDWHVRWTDYPVSGGYLFDGLIQVELGNSVISSSFASSENPQDWMFSINSPNRDYIYFNSFVDQGWDGIDFSLDPESDASVIRFSLGSTLFANGSNSSSPNAGWAEATNIFLGSDLNTIDANHSWNLATGNASFDISVPEPALFGLFGIGLVGLGFSRRLRKS